MLQNSFVLLDRIGYGREKKLWEKGVLSWEDFLDRKGISGISEKEKKHHDKGLAEAVENLSNNSSKYFSKRLKTRDYWRVFPEFKNRACFLDIETTGLSPNTSDITVVGIYDGRKVKSFVRGVNLSEELLVEELSKYSLILSFYGLAFDVPFMEKKYPSLNIDVPHIDLCFTGRRMGLTGGLKKIEKELGMVRDKNVVDVDGFEAVRLWKRWVNRGDEGALERLVEYNRADVVNLKLLADIVYRGLKAKTFNHVM